MVQHLHLLRGRRGHHLLDPGDEDLARGVDELAHEEREIGHGLVHRAPEHARVQVARGAGHVEFVVRNAAQPVRQSGRASVEPVVVGLVPASLRHINSQREIKGVEKS